MTAFDPGDRVVFITANNEAEHGIVVETYREGDQLRVVIEVCDADGVHLGYRCQPTADRVGRFRRGHEG